MMFTSYLVVFFRIYKTRQKRFASAGLTVDFVGCMGLLLQQQHGWRMPRWFAFSICRIMRIALLIV